MKLPRSLWFTTAVVSSTVAGIACGTTILFIWVIVSGALPPSTVAVAVIAAASGALLAATAAVSAGSAACHVVLCWLAARA